MPLLNPSKGWSSSTSRLLALYSFLFVAWSSILMGVLYFEVSSYLNKLTRHSMLQRQHLFAHMSGKQLDDALIASQAFDERSFDAYGLFDAQFNPLGGQIRQIGIRQTFLHHEDSLVAAVGLHQVRHAKLLQFLTGAETVFTHPAQLTGRRQAQLVIPLRQQDATGQPHEVRGKTHLLLPGVAGGHADQHVDLAIEQGLLGSGIVGIGLVAQGQSQPARDQGGKIIERAAETTPAIGIDIGGPGHRGHADHQVAARGEPQPLGQPQSILVQTGFCRGGKAPAGKPAQQEGAIAKTQHGQLLNKSESDDRDFGKMCE